jgi:hypothetical protein
MEACALVPAPATTQRKIAQCRSICSTRFLALILLTIYLYIILLPREIRGKKNGTVEVTPMEIAPELQDT